MSKQVEAAAIIFENEAGEILVLRRHADRPEGVTWGLVGGKLESGEDAAAAAVREVQEEIGHVVDDSTLRFFKTYHWNREDLDITFHVFRLPIQSGDVTLQLDQTEHSEHMWAMPSDLYARDDLMTGLYPILQDVFGVGSA